MIRLSRRFDGSARDDDVRLTGYVVALREGGRALPSLIVPPHAGRVAFPLADLGWLTGLTLFMPGRDVLIPSRRDPTRTRRELTRGTES